MDRSGIAVVRLVYHPMTLATTLFFSSLPFSAHSICLAVCLFFVGCPSASLSQCCSLFFLKKMVVWCSVSPYWWLSGHLFFRLPCCLCFQAWVAGKGWGGGLGVFFPGVSPSALLISTLWLTDKQLLLSLWLFLNPYVLLQLAIALSISLSCHPHVFKLRQIVFPESGTSSLISSPNI